ncbi:MAG TPA: hypothetical protein PKH29_02455, partial [Oscillospiraceae bacterium]|nr:hypothetical protein [Oscillospiraceae bacterium]
NGLAGYVAVLNAPASPRKNAAAAMTADTAAAAAALLPVDKELVIAVIAPQSDVSALYGFEKYAQFTK